MGLHSSVSILSYYLNFVILVEVMFMLAWYQIQNDVFSVYWGLDGNSVLPNLIISHVQKKTFNPYWPNNLECKLQMYFVIILICFLYKWFYEATSLQAINCIMQSGYIVFLILHVDRKNNNLNAFLCKLSL